MSKHSAFYSRQQDKSGCLLESYRKSPFWPETIDLWQDSFSNKGKTHWKYFKCNVICLLVFLECFPNPSSLYPFSAFIFKLHTHTVSGQCDHHTTGLPPGLAKEPNTIPLFSNNSVCELGFLKNTLFSACSKSLILSLYIV